MCMSFACAPQEEASLHNAAMEQVCHDPLLRSAVADPSDKVQHGAEIKF